MRILHFSDVHIGKPSTLFPKAPSESINLQDIVIDDDFCKHLAGVDVAVFGGDLFDNRRVVATQDVILCKRTMLLLANKVRELYLKASGGVERPTKIPFYLLTGNHDASVGDNRISMLEMFSGLDNEMFDFRIVKDYLQEVIIDGVKLAFIPYFCMGKQTYLKDWLVVNETIPTVVFMHREIDMLNIELAKGDNLANFRANALVVLSHYHNYTKTSKLLSKSYPDLNFVVTGSTHVFDRNDANEYKGYITIDYVLKKHEYPEVNRYYFLRGSQMYLPMYFEKLSNKNLVDVFETMFKRIKSEAYLWRHDIAHLPDDFDFGIAIYPNYHIDIIVDTLEDYDLGKAANLLLKKWYNHTDDSNLGRIPIEIYVRINQNSKYQLREGLEEDYTDVVEFLKTSKVEDVLESFVNSSRFSIRKQKLSLNKVQRLLKDGT